MTIRLRIDNQDRLPDGGPLHYVGQRSPIVIGRGETLDWTLPDASCFVSNRHCEIRREERGYLLTDVSTNGTFLNGARQRVKSPHLLRDGDRLAIGPYVVAVEIAGEDTEADFDGPAERWAPPEATRDIWGHAGPGPAAIDRRELMPERQRGQRAPDFSQEFLSLSEPTPPQDREPASRPRPGTMPGEPVDAADPFGFAASPVRGHARGARREDGEGPALLRRLASGAGLDPSVFDESDAGATAEEVGRVLRIVVGHVHELLQARRAALTLVRSSSRTMIGPINNPLKNLASPEEVIEVMLGRRRQRYLGAEAAFDGAFADLKRHEIATYSAMQKALSQLLADLSPQAIEGKVTSSPFASRKAKNWDMYVARWEAKTEPHENGMLDVFLTYFADAYDESVKGG